MYCQQNQRFFQGVNSNIFSMLISSSCIFIPCHCFPYLCICSFSGCFHNRRSKTIICSGDTKETNNDTHSLLERYIFFSLFKLHDSRSPIKCSAIKNIGLVLSIILSANKSACFVNSTMHKVF